MLFFRSLFLLTAASLSVADQVIYSNGKLASGWKDTSDDTTSADFKGNTIAVHAEPFSFFGLSNSAVTLADFTGYRFDIKAHSEVSTVRGFRCWFI